VLGEDGVGEALDLDLFRDYELFLELAVDEGEALSPRQAMNAVPYARQAEHAASLSGGMVDATELRVGGTVVVDSTGTWVGIDPQLTEDEVDAYCADNGYAMDSDVAAGMADMASEMDRMEAGVTTDMESMEAGVTTDMESMAADMETDMARMEEDMAAMAADVASDMAAADAAETARIDLAVADSVEHYTESGRFTVPDGITSLFVYVTGGGGGGSNGSTTSLELGSHSHSVDAHAHGGGTHTHAVGDHSHEGGGSHTHSIGTSCVEWCHSGCCRWGTDYSGASTGGGGESTGSTGAVDDGETDSTELSTNGVALPGATVEITGGNGGSGGGMSAMLAVSGGTVCDIVVGTSGDVDGDGSETTITCGDSIVTCRGGSTGNADGTDGDDGQCDIVDGSRLTEYKASRLAPGGGGGGGYSSTATAGQAGNITVRY
jgi:hypothetical protein